LIRAVEASGVGVSVAVGVTVAVGVAVDVGIGVAVRAGAAVDFGFFFLGVGVAVGRCFAGLHFLFLTFPFLGQLFDTYVDPGELDAPTMPGPTASAGTTSSSTSQPNRRIFSSNDL
jgi:hypothetical protein